MQEQPTIHIFGDRDADGLVSAALLGSYLRQRHPHHDLRLEMMRADEFRRLSADHLFRGRMNDILAVVDLPFPTARPRRLYWADHHEAGPDTEKCVAGDFILWDRAAGSCAKLLSDHLYEAAQFAVPMSLRYAVSLADRIDQARYPSADAALDFERSEMSKFSLMACYLPLPPILDIATDLIDGFPLRMALERQKLAIQDLLSAAQASWSYAEQHTREVRPSFGILDWTEMDHAIPLPFAAFAALDLLFAGSIEAITGGFTCRFQYNPWKDTDHLPHLGRIADGLGGGGHQYAAGFFVDNHCGVSGAIAHLTTVIDRVILESEEMRLSPATR